MSHVGLMTTQSAGVDNDPVVPGAAMDAVRSGPAVDEVVFRRAVDDVSVRRSEDPCVVDGERVAAVTGRGAGVDLDPHPARRRVPGEGVERDVLSLPVVGTGPQHVVTRSATEQVADPLLFALVVVVEEVEAAVEPVVAAPAVEAVVAPASADQVVAAPPGDRVAAAEAGDHVPPGRAVDDLAAAGADDCRALAVTADRGRVRGRGERDEAARGQGGAHHHCPHAHAVPPGLVVFSVNAARAEHVDPAAICGGCAPYPQVHNRRYSVSAVVVRWWARPQ